MNREEILKLYEGLRELARLRRLDRYKLMVFLKSDILYIPFSTRNSDPVYK